MDLTQAQEEYALALRAGQREYKILLSEGKDPYPQVLDNILSNHSGDSVEDLGRIEIPAELIVGTKAAGRISAFSAGFLPLLDQDSEFAAKWIHLCNANLSEEGIRDPILCYEYLGKFYVQEGNKRVSVLKHMGAIRIPGIVRRILPVWDDSAQSKAYAEFIKFHRATGLYSVQFTCPEDYGKLLSLLGKEPDEPWTERERRTFSSYYQYFRDAFASLDTRKLSMLPEEALLLWLQVYPFRQLGSMTAKELKKSLSALQDDLLTFSRAEPALVNTGPDTKAGFLSWITAPSHLHVAFVHPLDTSSTWIDAHDRGRQHLESVLGDQVVVKNYFHADNPQLADQLLEQAVSDGADVVFATTPQLRRSVLRAAVKYPRVRFFNCSVDTHYSSVPSYYGRIYEAKFITGALAGAMANNDRIGYIASSPTFGVPASINAFALGAQLTNPRAKIFLRWSCQKGSHQQDFLRDGIWVISNRDAPTENPEYLNFGNYGTYWMDDDGRWEAIGSPVWLWGRFYENIISSMLTGAWDKEENSHKAINYWWGMDSGVIDVKLSDRLPTGMQALAELLRSGLQSGSLDPFHRRIVDQQGNIRNNGTQSFSPDTLMYMDWLCDNVIGSIPTFDEVEPYAQPMLRELGIHRDRIPREKEGSI